MLKQYRQLPPWSQGSIPKTFQEKHNTKEGTWAKLDVLRGSLEFTLLTEEGDEISSQTFSAGESTPFVEPQCWHKVTPTSDDLECQLAFYCEPDRYYEKRYKLTAPHSEVRKLLPHLGPPMGQRVLDLGSGRGRNSLFLHDHGFVPAAVDKSEKSIATLEDIQAQENIAFDTRVYDINLAHLGESYHHIMSTVVFQFLDPTRVAAIIDDMQSSTLSGGVNLIVAPVDTAEMPCPIPFSFCFEQGQLRNFYQGWEMITYEETPGEFHRRDEHGQRYRAIFATMVARKPWAPT